MNPLLVNKYEEEWEALLESFPATIFGDEEPTNPLLLDVPEEYFLANCKILIFGQETNDWDGLFPHPKNIDHLLENYRAFYNTDCCFSYGGQFWNGVSSLKKAFTEKLTKSGKTQSIVWNNIIKIGKVNNKGTPNNQILKWQDAWFDVVSFEVSVLEPDIVIFFTGPHYDKFITRVFGDAIFERLNRRESRQLARVKSRFLPEYAIRTYHPGYLWRNGFYEYIGEIIGGSDC